jgi:hypothetical protein
MLLRAAAHPDTPQQYSTQLLLADFVDETRQVAVPAYRPANAVFTRL